MNGDVDADAEVSGAAAPATPATPAAPSSEAGEGRPVPFPRRVVDVFVAPGRLGAALRDRPLWAAALLTGAALTLLQIALIPADVWEAFIRERLIQSGTKLPMSASMAGTQRIFSVVGGGVGYLLYVPFVAGIVALLFAFILGDEGRYRQYLAVVSHAFIIPVVFGLLTVPLKIAEKTPAATLNLGLFFSFLGGYWGRVLHLVDLTKIWGWLVVAAGVHAIDPKRSFRSAAVTLVGLSVVLAMVFAVFVHTT